MLSTKEIPAVGTKISPLSVVCNLKFGNDRSKRDTDDPCDEFFDNEEEINKIYNEKEASDDSWEADVIVNSEKLNKLYVEHEQKRKESLGFDPEGESSRFGSDAHSATSKAMQFTMLSDMLKDIYQGNYAEVVKTVGMIALPAGAERVTVGALDMFNKRHC